jgi:hypothetical protein
VYDPCLHHIQGLLEHWAVARYDLPALRDGSGPHLVTLLSCGIPVGLTTPPTLEDVAAQSSVPGDSSLTEEPNAHR